MTAYEQATATTTVPSERPVETAKLQVGAVTETAKDEAGAVAEVATHAASEVTDTAKEQVAQIAGDTKLQLNALTAQAKAQVSEQASTQTQRAAKTARSFADQLAALTQGRVTEGAAIDLVRELGERVQQIAAKLEASEPQELLGEVRRYARNKPGAFLLGAAAAGFVGGRLVKGASAEPDPGDRPSAKNGSSYNGAATSEAASNSNHGGTAAPAPIAGLESPSANAGFTSTYAAAYPEEPRSQPGLSGSM